MNLDINVPCEFENHQKKKITAICFHKDCKSKRLCCLRCHGEFHRTHLENVIDIDQFNSFIEQESNKQAEYPDSYTFGQCQLIQGLEGLLNQIDSFQNFIKEQIEKLKQSSLQEYLNQQAYAQQGVKTWNIQIEHLLEYFEVQNYLLTKKDQKQGELSETEQKSIIIINQAQGSFKQIEKSLHKFLQKKQLQFYSDPQYLEGHKNFVFGVAISQDGNLIASRSKDSTVKLWNFRTKKLMQTFQHHGEPYGAVAFSSNNQYLAYGGGGDYSIQLQDLKQNINYAALMGHEFYINTIVFSQDSQLLYSGGNDNKLIIWNISTKTQIHSFDTDSPIWAIVNSPDNIIISCICSKSINIWNYSTKTKLIYQKDPHNSEGYGLCSSKDSAIFISSGSDGLIKIWIFSDSENNQKSFKLTREIKAADSPIYQVILTSNEQYIVSMCNGESKIMIHEIKSEQLIQELHYCSQEHYNDYGQISISKNMNVLVSGGGYDKKVKIWTRE